MNIKLQGDSNPANIVDTKELQNLVGNMWPSDLLEIVKAHKKDPLTENEHDAIRQGNSVLNDGYEGYCGYQLPVLLNAIKRLTNS